VGYAIERGVIGDDYPAVPDDAVIFTLPGDENRRGAAR
jgi:hypothetical protein